MILLDIHQLIPSAAFAIAPAFTTFVFTMFWAGSHYASADSSGLLPQRVFPAVIG